MTQLAFNDHYATAGDSDCVEEVGIVHCKGERVLYYTHRCVYLECC